MGRAMGWLRLKNLSVLSLFVLLCLFSVVLAWASFGLAMAAMANLDGLERFGLWSTMMSGGLPELLGIAAKGCLGLLSYLGFKGTEVELVDRWRRR